MIRQSCALKCSLVLLLLVSMEVSAEQVFYLCADNVSDWRQAQGLLYIQLSVTATDELARLTHQAQGKRLSVRIANNEMVNAVVRAPVDSGRIVLDWPYRHRLQAFPDSPCGQP